MRRGWRVGLIGVFGALVASIDPAYGQLTIIPQEAVQRAANPKAHEGSTIRFAEGGTLSFGTISEDEPHWQGEIEWHNTTGKKISITRITTSCNCLVAEWDRKANTAKSSGKVRVKYYPKGHAGEVHQRLFVYTTLSESEPSAIVDVVGTVTHSTDRGGDYPHAMGTLRLRQRGVTLPKEGGTARIAILNGGSTPLRVTHDGTLTMGGLRAYTEPTTLSAGEEGDLVVEYCPDGAPAMLFLVGINTPPRGRKVEITIENNK